MKQIIWLVLVMALCSSAVLAADVVQREGKDVVRYSMVELERYKDVPSAVPNEEAIKIVQSGKGEYVLPEKKLKLILRARLPIMHTYISEETAWQYRDGAWVSSATQEKPPFKNSTWGTIFLLVFPTVALMVMSIGNRITSTGGSRLLLPYGFFVTAPLVTMWWSNYLGPFLVAAIVLIFLAICSDDFEWKFFPAIANILGLLLVSAATYFPTWESEMAFSIIYPTLLSGSCLASYVVSRLFFKRPVPPVPLES